MVPGGAGGRLRGARAPGATDAGARPRPPEARHYHRVRVPAALARKHAEFVGLKTVGGVFSERQVGHAEPTAETRYYISSLAPDVQAFADAVRGHRGIENHSHGVVDLTSQEDASRVRTDSGAENLGRFRRIARSVLEQVEEGKRTSLAGKRKRAGWNDQFPQKVLLGRSAR